jgi:predicted DNA-binding antitoxin AbrB/MazE fold protein
MASTFRYNQEACNMARGTDMSQTVDAIYERGVLRPVSPLEGVVEHSRVRITVESPGHPGNKLKECAGILPDEDAKEMRHIIDEEFEKVDLSEWE